MFCKTIFYKISILLIAAFPLLHADAQVSIDCEKAASILPAIQKRADNITTTDPELISLHYLFVNDMLEQLEEFETKILPNLHYCENIDFYESKHRFRRVQKQLLELKDTLEVLRHRVDTLFYLQAVDELHHDDTVLADYYIDRALEFNRLNTDALITKVKLLFAAGEYDECIKRIHILYNEAPLKREHENELSDFTASFYDKLFTTGDSLIKIGHAADALPVFLTLETFCHDMPSTYCNDDYYRGIIRSKTGVYESYLKIAQVAWAKKNYGMAYTFLDYAQEYLDANEEMIEPSREYLQFKEMLEAKRAALHANTEESEPASDNSQETETAESPVTADTLTAPESAPSQPIAYDAEKHATYQKLFTNALFDLYLGDKASAQKKLMAAIDLEACGCFPRDGRVQLVYDGLSAKGKKQKKQK